MIDKNIAKYLSRHKRYENTPVVDTADITAIDGEIRINTNGTPCTMLIQYKGVVYFDSQMPITINVSVGKNSILITNLFKLKFPELMFLYSGNLDIMSCRIMSFNNHSILATINNKQNADLVHLSDTNLEDADGSLLPDEEHQNIKSEIRGIRKNRIDMSRFDSSGKIQKFGNKEKEDVSSAILKSMPGLISSATAGEKKVRKRRSFSPKPSIEKMAPNMDKPTVSKPTVSKPSVSKPTISSPKIEETKGKY